MHMRLELRWARVTGLFVLLVVVYPGLGRRSRGGRQVAV